MWWAAAAQFGMSLFGASRQSRAAGMAGTLGDLNAKSEKIEWAETRRRMILAFRDMEGSARAMAAGSGLSQKKGNSQSRYIASMINEHRKQIRAGDFASMNRYKIAKMGGDLAKLQGKNQAYSTLIQGFGAAMSTYAATK